MIKVFIDENGEYKVYVSRDDPDFKKICTFWNFKEGKLKPVSNKKYLKALEDFRQKIKDEILKLEAANAVSEMLRRLEK